METIAIAKTYLSTKKYVLPSGRLLLAFFNNDFYSYEINHWRRIDEKDIQNDLINLIQNESIKVSDKFSFSHIESCIRILEALVTVKDFKFGSFINHVTPPNTHLIPVQNGILKVTSNLGELDVSLSNHTPDFIAPYALPYDYDSSKECPEWLKFLTEILSPDQIILLQEWFGYQLVPVTFAQKFMMFNGAGANGKSVVCLVLRLMLGEENVSSVSLQGFLSGDRFSLSATKDKLANIVPEIDELKTFPTGRIKSFTAGEPFTVEQKFKDSYLITPTARLTFATNTLPPFRDKSDGLKRRMLLLNFMIQIMDESKQDKRLVDEKYWLGLGELSGILNWSLEGLRRLMLNSWKFTISSTIMSAIDDYNKELNPIEGFLDEYVQLDGRGQYHTQVLYTQYVEYCRRQGLVADNNIVFGRAVGRHFKGIIRQSKHWKVENGLNARVWLGICPKRHRPWDITSDELRHLDSITQITQIAQIEEDKLISEKKLLSDDSKGGIYESSIS